MDIQVGDLVTYKSINEPDYQARQKIIINEDDIAKIHSCIKENQIEILKIERPKYEVVEEKKELLTEEEKEFLKMIYKFRLDGIKTIKKQIDEDGERLRIKGNLDFITNYIPTKEFRGLELEKEYTLKDLGLEED